MEFRELADLRLFLLELRAKQVESLAVYYDKKSGGFYHRHDNPTPGKPSRASSSTCILSLIATNEWHQGPWQARTATLVQKLLAKPWKSAGLEPDNAFTVGFIFEAVSELIRAEPGVQLNRAGRVGIARAQKILQGEAAKGALSVQGYPPSAYVTQLVVRALRREDALTTRAAAKIADWAEREINKQIALLTGNDKTADTFQLAYSAILLANLVKPDRITPDQEFFIDAALNELFARQRHDGTWPLSRPLFHYPNVGSAHCYDYEMLVQLLSEPRLTEKLLKFIPKLAISAYALRSSFRLGAAGAGWSSGHHPQFRGPESWSTASVYHFAHALERLLAEQVRRDTFSYFGTQYKAPRRLKQYTERMPAKFLDCPVKIEGRERSLKAIVSEKVISPLIGEERESTIESGRKLSKNTPVSIIFFGPPGTSKTNLAEIIGDLLGWPVLAVDASQFLKNGMDGVYAEADRIFGMLAVAERIVVLLDEFDEMVRAREISPDVLSRFLTTAMLPKLHKINDNRRLVFIVATNHIEAFDVAIRRPGRFDVILQVMPPTAQEKLQKWIELRALRNTGLTDSELRERLKPLTYLETASLVRRLALAKSARSKRNTLDTAHDNCTLLNPVRPSESSPAPAKAPVETDAAAADEQPRRWIEVCEEQSSLSRVN